MHPKFSNLRGPNRTGNKCYYAAVDLNPPTRIKPLNQEARDLEIFSATSLYKNKIEEYPATAPSAFLLFDELPNTNYSGAATTDYCFLDQQVGYNNVPSFPAANVKPSTQVNLQLQWHQQQELCETEQTAKKPWWIWVIAVVDIVAGVWYTGQLIALLLTKPVLDPNTFIWKVFMDLVAICARVLMGSSLLMGIFSNDVTMTILYCKYWTIGQLIFLAIGAIEVVLSVLMISLYPAAKEEEMLILLLAGLIIFMYRVVCFILVRIFSEQLQTSEQQLTSRLQLQNAENVQGNPLVGGNGEGHYVFGQSLELQMSVC